MGRGKTDNNPTDDEVLDALRSKMREKDSPTGFSRFTNVCKFYSPIVAAVQSLYKGTRVEQKERHTGLVSMDIPGEHPYFPVDDVRREMYRLAEVQQGGGGPPL